MFLVSACIVFAQYIEAKCEVENEDVVGAAPTGDAPTTSEWSTIQLPTKLLKTWRYITMQLEKCLLINADISQEVYDNIMPIHGMLW